MRTGTAWAAEAPAGWNTLGTPSLGTPRPMIAWIWRRSVGDVFVSLAAPWTTSPDWDGGTIDASLAIT
jgi:hypothetical protein